jgi:peptidoglycan/LPS O-acetylase OafA/YrhL
MGQPGRRLQSTNHYPALDGLRGLAALMVVYGHAGYAGWVPLVVGCATIGVVLFFFLSGFLMGHHYFPGAPAGMLRREFLRYWGAFLSRRFIRVYPPYVFAPIAGYLILMPRMPPDFAQVRQPGDFSVVDELVKIMTFDGKLGIYWTIEVELFFYLAYPLIITLCLLCRNKAGTLFLLCATLIFLNHFRGPGGVSWNMPLPGSWSGYTSVFVAGVFTAVIASKSPGLLHGTRIRWNSLTLLSFLSFALVVTLVSQSDPTQGSIWRLEWLFAALFFVMFISLIHSDGIISTILSSRLCASIGRASYSLYLTHIIAISIVFRFVPHEYQGILPGVVVLIALTATYYMLVERPFVVLSKRIKVNRNN